MRRGRARRARGALVALLVAVAACGSRTPEPLVLETFARLTAMVEPPLPADVPAACEIGDESRPALGCAPRVLLPKAPLALGADGAARISVAIPPRLRGVAAVVVPRVRASEREAWRDLVPLRLSAAETQGEPAIDVVVPEEPGGARSAALSIQLELTPLPPVERRFTTAAVAVPRGARLDVALGLDPLAADLGGGAVEFRVTAIDGAREIELLRETLAPSAAVSSSRSGAMPGSRGAAARWHDRRIDLGAISGRSVRLAFSTRAVAPPGASHRGDHGVGHDGAPVARPLWGSPAVLAPRAAAGRRNVILISLDTLRGDHVGGEMGGIRLTPFLDRLAGDATRFRAAWTVYPSTMAAHMSLLTGVYPARHQVGLERSRLERGIATLAEILAAAGYATGAITENGLVVAGAGFARGFDSYRENRGLSLWDAPGEIDATFADGVAWLERHRDERFFLFLHTYEVHSPYAPAPAYDRFRTWSKDGVEVPIDARTPWVVAQSRLYAGEVRYVDGALRRLFGELDRLGLLAGTIVVVTSDHGEEFKEHGVYGHGRTVNEAVIDVPLLLHAPGIAPAGAEVRTPVSLVDVAPTLLDLNGIAPPGVMQGRSLAPLLRGEPFPGDRPVFALRVGERREDRLVAARVGDLKWIFRGDAREPVAVYDLARDRGERRSLESSDPRAIGPSLLDAYAALGAPNGPTEDTAASLRELDARTVRKLEALGYLERTP